MNSSLIRARRRRTGTAAAAYSHALSLVGDAGAAEVIASTALRRGAQSRSAVLAHARHLTAERAVSAVASDPVAPASTDLRTLARQLSASRPVEERSLVDLELRYGLDHGSFSRVLGVSGTRARQRSSAVASAWNEALDPAMMASLGPGACDDLARILRDNFPAAPEQPVGSSESLAATGTDNSAVTAISPEDQQRPTIGLLLEVAPVVLTHAQTCEVCAQRLKLMTPVRSLVGQVPAEDVPQSVHEAARFARRLIPTPLPPSIDVHRIDLRRMRAIAFTGVAVVIAIAVVVGIGKVAVDAATDESQSDRVAKLVDAAPTSSLLATPSVITTDVTTASLANNSEGSVLWNVTTSAPWITVEPTSGRLSPTQSVSLNVKSTKSGSGTITLTGSDGSKQTIRVEN